MVARVSYSVAQRARHREKAHLYPLRQRVRGLQSLSRVAHEFDEDVARMIHALESWVTGNLDWSFAMSRYFGSETSQIRKTLRVRLSEVEC